MCTQPFDMIIVKDLKLVRVLFSYLGLNELEHSLGKLGFKLPGWVQTLSACGMISMTFLCPKKKGQIPDISNVILLPFVGCIRCSSFLKKNVTYWTRPGRPAPVKHLPRAQLSKHSLYGKAGRVSVVLLFPH